MSLELDLLFGDSRDLAKLKELLNTPKPKEKIAPAPRFQPDSLWLFTTKIKCLHCGEYKESLKYFEVMLRSTIVDKNRSIFEPLGDITEELLKLPRYIGEEREATTRMCKECFVNLPMPEQLPLPLPGPRCAFKPLGA